MNLGDINLIQMSFTAAVDDNGNNTSPFQRIQVRDLFGVMQEGACFMISLYILEK